MSTGSAHDGALPAESGEVVPPARSAAPPPASSSPRSATARLRAEVASLTREQAGDAGREAAVAQSGERERSWPSPPWPAGSRSSSAASRSTSSARLRTSRVRLQHLVGRPAVGARPLSAGALLCCGRCARRLRAGAAHAPLAALADHRPVCSSSPPSPPGTASTSTGPGATASCEPGLPVPLSLRHLRRAGLHRLGRAPAAGAAGAGGSPRPPSSSLTAGACVAPLPGRARSSSSARPTTAGPPTSPSSSAPRCTRTARPSTSLRDRMTTAIAALQGPPREAPHRLRRRGRERLQRGARDARHGRARPACRRSDVVVDSNGVSTNATVADTVPFFGADGLDAHPRRQPVLPPAARSSWPTSGPAGTCSPCRPATSSPIPQTPYFVVREIPAFWVYYLEAVFAREARAAGALGRSALRDARGPAGASRRPGPRLRFGW